jgi:hypothetical protein
MTHRLPPFVIKIANKYFQNENQSDYFTTTDGFGANIIVRDGVAEPNIDLNIQEGLKSRHLRKRLAFRLDKENPTDEDIFQFAAGHELGHLIQGEPEFEFLEDYDLTDLTKTDIKVLEWKIERNNKKIKENEDIIAAQDYFRSIFIHDFSREYYETPADPNNYTDEDYLRYVNSEAEANADFISLWIMGMRNPNMITSPQNEGYSLADWQKWAKDHKIDIGNLSFGDPTGN